MKQLPMNRIPTTVVAMRQILVLFLISTSFFDDCGASFCESRQASRSLPRGSMRMLVDSMGDGDDRRREPPSFRERLPRRLDVVREYASSARPHDYREEWGLSRDHQRDFPSTVSQVVNEAFLAVAGTLYQTQKLDPNIASNAMSKSIFTQRPVRKRPDAGRIGIEIDGAEHLFPEVHRLPPASGIRRVSLLLAAKLSKKESWEQFEHPGKSTKNVLKYRPVTVCFNTIKQALAASNDLKLLKLEHARGIGKDGVESPFENIQVQCVRDGIPKNLLLDRSRKRRNNGLARGFVNVTKGLLMVVQPTDYNLEHLPPGPAVDAVGNFQRLAAQATVEEVPMIVLSPRFLSNEIVYGGWDQSGYQKSAVYGGVEPPKGPTPWIMRDFTPPVFCWIGDALRLGSPTSRRIPEDNSEQCHLARVALSQSVMDPGHLWHIFVAKECNCGKEKLPTEYLFLASTKSSSGRPTRAVLKTILEDC